MFKTLFKKNIAEVKTIVLRRANMYNKVQIDYKFTCWGQLYVVTYANLTAMKG